MPTRGGKLSTISLIQRTLDSGLATGVSSLELLLWLRGGKTLSLSMQLDTMRLKDLEDLVEIISTKSQYERLEITLQSAGRIGYLLKESLSSQDVKELYRVYRE